MSLNYQGYNVTLKNDLKTLMDHWCLVSSSNSALILLLNKIDLSLMSKKKKIKVGRILLP